MLDLLMILLAWFGAHWLRFNLVTIPEAFWDRALQMAPFVLVGQAIIGQLFGVLLGVWRYTSIQDMLRIIKAVVIGSVLLFLFVRLAEVPRSVALIYLLLLVGLPGSCCLSLVQGEEPDPDVGQARTAGRRRRGGRFAGA